MAFRNVIISNRCKLSYSLNYLVCRKENEEIKICIDEIKLLIIESNEVAITSALISMLIEKKVKIIFCDSLHNPSGEVTPYFNNYYSYRKIKEQLEFIKNPGELWKKIVQKKILNQSRNLLLKGKRDEASLLINYYNNVEVEDSTNREGHSAKVYFNALFGNDFSRDKDCLINHFLNYGYSILLSLINREIKSLGFLTEIGIHHIGESNSFNFSCDLIEPLRPLVDSMVIGDDINSDNYKRLFINMLSMEVKYNEQEMFLDNAIHLYVINMINYLKNRDEESIRFVEYEL